MLDKTSQSGRKRAKRASFALGGGSGKARLCNVRFMRQELEARHRARAILEPERHTSRMSLNAIPLDILIDSILPSLPPDALGNLAQTDKDFYALVQGPAGESVWRRKAEEDFHFPTANTGRRSGWRELYRRLLKQSCYIWGQVRDSPASRPPRGNADSSLERRQNSNGRLGISADDHSSKRHLIQGGLPLPTRLPLSATVVGLEAGGYSFHALTSSGAIISWGTMDGDNWARGGALSHVRACAYTPFELPASKTGALGEVVQVQAGRKHVVVRNTKGEVWEYRSFGRAYQFVPPRCRLGVRTGAE